MALISMGRCAFATKVLQAQAAGAVAVIVFNQPDGPALFPPTGLGNTAIPSVLVSSAAGTFLKTYLATHSGAVITLDPAPSETTPATADMVSYFSSRGPTIGDAGIKPDLSAPGSSIYTAAQNYDPNGDLYGGSRYIGVDGTSFAAALAAGAAALVKQAHPGYTSGQIKSALTNTAASGILDFDANGNAFPARSITVGGGKLNLGSAITSTLTMVPASVSFGAVNDLTLTNGVLATRSILITNTGPTSANISLTVQQRDTDANAAVTVNPAALPLAAGQSSSVTLTLTGRPGPGIYEGGIAVAGGAVPLHIPYLYLMGDGAPYHQIPLLGRNFVTEAGTAVDLAFRVVDRFGVPVKNIPVRFAPPGAVHAATPATDSLGIAEGYLKTTSLAGDQVFSADLLENAGRIEFDGRVRAQPQIDANGVIDAASFLVPDGFAPGSYISIFGAGLSDSSSVAHTPYLPVSLSGVSVSFDVPAANIHVPGRLYFVSAGQISVQIPWELAGAPSAIMKVTLANSVSKTVRSNNSLQGTYQTQTFTLRIAAYSPALFEYADGPSGKRAIAALDEQSAVVGSANPVQRGHVLQLFVNGLGAVAPGTQPASGEPSRGTLPLAITLATPSVAIDGQPASVQFSGLAPGIVGLYQVNVVVPQTIKAGSLPLTLSIGGVASKPTLVEVQ
jgi:minor extracellular serine protease Vpr